MWGPNPERLIINGPYWYVSLLGITWNTMLCWLFKWLNKYGNFFIWYDWLFGNVAENAGSKSILYTISNIHYRLHGIAPSTPPGPKYREIVDEKIIGIFEYFVGFHIHNGSKNYKKCLHGPIGSAPLDRGTCTILQQNAWHNQCILYTLQTF